MKFFAYLILLAAAAYTIFGAALFVFQGHMVYAPDRPLGRTPGSIGLAFEDIEFSAADGVDLHGWWVPHENPAGTVLFCHGNAGNVSHLIARIESFNRLGLNVFVFDYRGFGRSGGSPSEAGTYRDAEAAWHHLIAEADVPADRILVCGLSLGGPMAAHIASQFDPRGLILEATFTSIPDLAADLYPMFPARRLARFRYSTIESLEGALCPTLVVHGPKDDLIPFAHGQRLFEAAKGPRFFLEVSGGHGDWFDHSRVRYEKELKSFLTATRLAG